MTKSNMKLTSETDTDFWNDSCGIKELSEAVEHGASGATSNPVIVYNVTRQEQDIWVPVIDKLIKENPQDSEDEIAWKFIEQIGIKAAKILEPVFNNHNGLKGRLSLQVNPQFYPNKNKMVAHAKHLSSLAPNIAIKAPCTETGIQAMEDMTANGIIVNGTVCYTIPQAVACAEAVERGLEKAKKNGIDISKMTPYVTIMIGRLDDHLRGIMAKGNIIIDPGYLEWAGIATIKKAYKIFQEKGYHSTLLAAAYRNYMQWYELIGGKIVLTIPYNWWNKFNHVNIKISSRIDHPVNQNIIDELYEKFDDFKKAYDENGMQPSEFIHYGASIHTLNQFISGYYELLGFIRNRMLQ